MDLKPDDTITDPKLQNAYNRVMNLDSASFNPNKTFKTEEVMQKTIQLPKLQKQKNETVQMEKEITSSLIPGVQKQLKDQPQIIMRSVNPLTPHTKSSRNLFIILGAITMLFFVIYALVWTKVFGLM